MAWTTPTNPVAGTVITVAYAVTNFVNNLLHLRALTGAADPPGSHYTIRSTSTSLTDWSKVTNDMIDNDAVLGHHINDLAIGTQHIGVEQVTNAKIALNTIDLSTRAAVGSLTGDRVANDTLTQTNLAADSVGTSELINLNVTTGKLAAGAVTHDKMTVVAPLSSIQGPPLPLTTSNQDLAQITAAVAGLYIVHAHVVLYTTTTAGDINQNLTSWLNAPTGIVGTLFRHYTGSVAVDQNAVQAQTALIQLTVGQQVTLRAKKSGGTGNSGANDGTLIAVRISA